MAQDFYAAFGLGEDKLRIGTVDADGVMMAAIQGLNAKLKDDLKAKDTEIADLKAAMAKQKAETDARFARLERLIRGKAR